MSQNLKRQLENLEEGSPPFKKAHLLSEDEFFSAKESPSTRNPTANQSIEPSPAIACNTTEEKKNIDPTVLDFEDKSQEQDTEVLQISQQIEDTTLENPQDIQHSEAHMIPATDTQPLDNLEHNEAPEPTESIPLAETTESIKSTDQIIHPSTTFSVSLESISVPLSTSPSESALISTENLSESIKTQEETY